MVKDRYGYGTQEPDLYGLLNSDEQKEWLKSSWDSKNDIHILKALVGAMSIHGGYGEQDDQRFLNDYMTMLKQVSVKKGAPSIQDLHGT